VVQYLVDLAPTLLVAAFFLIFSLNWPRHATWSRAVTCAVVLAVALRYLAWRFVATVLAYPVDWSFGFFWTWFVFLVELGAFADILLFLVAMGR
jgi:cellulose synthase (UDP-forming)